MATCSSARMFGPAAFSTAAAAMRPRSALASSGPFRRLGHGNSLVRRLPAATIAHVSTPPHLAMYPAGDRSQTRSTTRFGKINRYVSMYVCVM